ncbi:MAG: lipopolysaccharide biosynthesis protein, partial [bacterium]|nr:lipopolysaccharide biosynthesis protein [bacterium]
FSTVFYANIVFCMILYILLFFASPFIAKFYDMPELTSVVRVLGLTIVISGVKNVQQAYVSRHMIFKRFFYATLGGTIGAAVIGILMAYLGCGVWSLVAQNLFNLTVDTIILWITVKWRPELKFSWKRLKVLYSYGWKLLLSSLLHTVYTDIRQLIIGKLYSSESLALYNKGKQFPNLIATNINNSIDSVLFPAMSVAQDNKEKVKKMTCISIRVSGYIMWPVMIGLSAVTEPLVRILLTDKWIGCIPFLRIFCITNAFQPIHTANLNAIKAMGRSDLYLKLEIIKKVTGIAILLAVMNFGVMAIGYSLLVYSVFAQIVNSWPNRELLNYSYKDQLKDIVPFIILSLVMAVPIYFIGKLPLPLIVVLAIQVITGAIIYIAESLIFKLDTFEFIKDRLSELLRKK